MATQQEVINAFMKSLDRSSSTLSVGSVLTNAIKACSSFKSLQDVINELISDCQTYIRKDSKNGWKKFLEEKCDIDLSNSDTGAITGADAGGSSTKTDKSIVPESGKASYPSDTSFTKRGLTVIIPEKNKLTSAQQNVIKGLYSWWIDSALELIEESYGYSFTDSDVEINKITVKFVDNSKNVRATVDLPKGTDELTLTINMRGLSNFSVSDKKTNGESDSDELYLDRVFAHELTHAVMLAKVNYFGEFPVFISEGVAELTHGVDDIRYDDIKKLISNPTELKFRLNTSRKSNEQIASDLDYAAGYIFMRYLAKQGESTYALADTPINVSNKKNITGNTGDDLFIVKSGTKSATINTAGGDDTIQAFSGDGLLIKGSAYDEIITVIKSTIKGSGTVASIVGGAGNDTLIGSDGSDVFVFGSNDGKNVITNYDSKNDTIKITSGKISKVALNDSDVILSVGKGSVTVKNAKDKSLNIIDSVGKSFATIISDTITVTNSDKSPVTADSFVKTIDAAKRTTAVKITGNALDNSISGGSNKDTISGGDGDDTINGNAGNDSLFGGKGDDSISGGDGADKINGSDGKDTLNGGDGNDYIQGDAGNDSIQGGAGNDTLWGGVGADKIYGNANDDLLFGNDGNDSLSGGDGNDYIQGDAGKDTIDGGKGTNTLWGGAGNDLFVHSGGNDIIADFFNGSNKIKISSGNISKATIKNSDVILTVGKGAITVKNANNKSLNIIDSVGKSFATIISDIATITDSDKSSVTIGSAIKTIDATKRKTAIKITGNALDNSISGGSHKDTILGGDGDDTINGNAGNDSLLGGKGDDSISGGDGADKLYGNAGNDTLSGGKGNDSLWGGDGADVFIYQSGGDKDVIYDFDSNDMLKFQKGVVRYSMNSTGTEIYFNFDSTEKAVTLKNLTTNEININGATYAISNSKLIPK